MVINYESIVKAIEGDILEYTNNPDFESSNVLQNTVNGMYKTLCILDDVKRESSYYKALAGLDRNDLRNLRDCIDSKIRDIEKEEKVKLYRLSIDGICYYYSTLEYAKNALLKEFDDYLDSIFDELSVEIDSIYVAQSELHSYRIIK